MGMGARLIEEQISGHGDPFILVRDEDGAVRGIYIDPQDIQQYVEETMFDDLDGTDNFMKQRVYRRTGRWFAEKEAQKRRQEETYDY